MCCWCANLYSEVLGHAPSTLFRPNQAVHGFTARGARQGLVRLVLKEELNPIRIVSPSGFSEAFLHVSALDRSFLVAGEMRGSSREV